MTLVVKNKNIALDKGEKLYRDALVTEGTLFLIDFSNRGTTDNYNVQDKAIVYDLAREASNPLSINANGNISTPFKESQLTNKKGFSANGIEGAGNFGVIVPSLLNYLSHPDVQNHKILFTFWINTGVTGVSRGFMRSVSNNNYANTALRANIAANGNLTLTIAGAAALKPELIPIPNTDVQMSYLYQGVGLPIKVWMNGIYRGETTEVATGFNSINHTITIGKPEIAAKGNQTLYRMLVEDLNISERDEAKVIKKDFNYVNALEEYKEIEKRPFSII